MDFHLSRLWFHSTYMVYMMSGVRLLLGYILTTVTRSISSLSRNLRTTFHESPGPGYGLCLDYF